MKIENEEQLKHVLDEKGFRYGDRFPTFAFVVSFLDSETCALLASNVFKSPIDGVAALPAICKETHRSVDSVKIILDFGFDYNTRIIKDIDIELDKYIYFTKPEEKTETNESSETENK